MIINWCSSLGSVGSVGSMSSPETYGKDPLSPSTSQTRFQITDIRHRTHCLNKYYFIVWHFDLLSPAEPRRANVLTAWESSPTLDTTSTNSTCRYREEFINLTHNFKLAYWRWPRPWLLTFYVEKTLFVWLVLSVALLGKSNVWTQNVEQRRFCS